MGAVDKILDYDVAISFAGEQRSEAEGIADHLQAAGVTVFYDAYEQVDLWGKNLYDHLAVVYQHKARYCLMLVSAAYAAKVWTTHERQSAQARALTQNTEYILPVRFDDTDVPGLLQTVGYVRRRETAVEIRKSAAIIARYGHAGKGPKVQCQLRRDGREAIVHRGTDHVCLFLQCEPNDLDIPHPKESSTRDCSALPISETEPPPRKNPRPAEVIARGEAVWSTQGPRGQELRKADLPGHP
jgi:hypothetical protein